MQDKNKQLLVCGIDTRTKGAFLDELMAACRVLGLRRCSMGFDVGWDVVSVADIVVAHVFDEEDGEPQRSEEWKTLIERAKRGSRIVRVSTAPKRCPKPTNIDGKYVLHLCPSTLAVRAQWQSILLELCSRTSVEEFIRDPVGRGLERFFLCKSIDHLLAMAVLCQGYLAMHATQTKGWGPKGIMEALERMEWPRFMARRGDVQERIERRLADAQTSRRLKEDVSRPDWWQEALSTTDPLSACDEEWGAEKGVAWAKLAPLLAMIRDGQRIPEPSSEPHPVANAFLGLYERLERHPR